MLVVNDGENVASKIVVVVGLGVVGVGVEDGERVIECGLPVMD